ncbi:FO synthase subunit 1 [Durusdinium trenchii]|uniref:FO synthase subunit 1 n=1 Tax=Durusdinium trenchii TaxID=1381693 RepID=A0ABP0IBL9_9DINO
MDHSVTIHTDACLQAGLQVLLLIDRLQADWDRCPIKKAWNFKDTNNLHAACGAYRHFVGQLKSTISDAAFKAHMPVIRDQFMMSYLDTELLNALSTSTPPGDVKSISAMRRIVEEAENAQTIEQEKRAAELSERVNAATLEQLEARISADFALLKKIAPSAEKDAKEAHLDMRKGQQHVRTWMSENFKVLVQPEGQMGKVLTEFAKFKGELNQPGQKPCYILVLLDATVYPANAAYLEAASQALSTVLHFGGHCIGHIQAPVPHSNTTQTALVKHRGLLEDSLMGKSLDITARVCLNFQRPPDAHQGDKRRVVQDVIAASAESVPSSWNVPSVIGPLPMIKTQDMLGFEDARPGPTARAEQKGIPCHSKILDAYVGAVDFANGETFIVLDLIPNRQAEFARATLKHMLAASPSTQSMKYFGVFRADQKDILNQLEEQIYSSWDASSDAPPKQRERSAQEKPELGILRWDQGVPKFTEDILRKFPQGCAQNAAVLKLEKELESFWPRPANHGSGSGKGDSAPASSPRVTGEPRLDRCKVH